MVSKVQSAFGPRSPRFEIVATSLGITLQVVCILGNLGAEGLPTC